MRNELIMAAIGQGIGRFVRVWLVVWFGLSGAVGVLYAINQPDPLMGVLIAMATLPYLAMPSAIGVAVALIALKL